MGRDGTVLDCTCRSIFKTIMEAQYPLLHQTKMDLFGYYDHYSFGLLSPILISASEAVFLTIIFLYILLIYRQLIEFIKL